MPTTMWVKKIIPLKISPGEAMSYIGSRSTHPYVLEEQWNTWKKYVK